MQGGVYMSTTPKYRRRTLSIDCQFERLQTQWKNGQSGAGAWFWQHFKPVLQTVHEGNKELHLQCLHCSKLFSARNPSRTSLEHLKSGACNAFRRTAAYEQVKSTTRPCDSGKKGRGKGLKRPDSGTVEEFGRKRSGNEVLEGPNIPPDILSSATNALSYFFLESGIPATLLSHPRLLEFCSLIGIVPPIPEQLLTSILQSRYVKIRQENEMRMRKTGVYQIAAHGWKTGNVTISINFQEGPPAFFKSLSIPEGADYDVMEIVASVTEEVDAIMDRRNCIGWVTDPRPRDRQAWAAAEERYPWMINTVCQEFAIRSLLKDLDKHIKVVRGSLEETQRLARYFNSHPVDLAALRRKDPSLLLSDLKTVHPVVAKSMTLESVYRYRSPIESLFVDESNLSQEVESVAGACLDGQFWECIGAVYELLQPILTTHNDVEQIQPHSSQILDMWLNLGHVFEEWCQRRTEIATGVFDIFVKRFNKSYHPSLAAAYLLDPGFCIKYDEKSYHPNWDRLHEEQQTDAQFVLKKVSAPNRGGRVISDFSRWRSQGLPAEFGNVVSDRALVGVNCLSKCVPMALRKTTWTSCLKDYEALGIVAHRLLSMRATAMELAPEPENRSEEMTVAAIQLEHNLEYVRKNAKLTHQRIVDERLLDADLIAMIAAYPDDSAVAMHSTFEKHGDPGICQEETPEGDMEETSQLYLHQLQLGTVAQVPQSVLRMSPPPLGTIPELPLNESADMSSPSPAAIPLEKKEKPPFDGGDSASRADPSLSAEAAPVTDSGALSRN